MSTAHEFLYWLAALLIRAILRINGGLKVIGKENIPLDTGVIIAANHISYLDPPFLGSVVPKPAIFMARKGLFDMPILGWMIKPAAIPVDRQKTRPSTIKEILKRLKNNDLIIIFPEGRRSDSGELLEAKRGIGMIASLSKAIIVPALIMGTDKILPPEAKWLKRGKATVVFGNPIHYNLLSGDKEKGFHDVHEDISNKIMSAIKELGMEFKH